jgi:CheY-like chemotaxis protein
MYIIANNIIVDLLTIFKTQAFNQNISLFAKQQLPDQQSIVSTDGTKITQILTNLITNALKFTHQGSVEFGYHIVMDAPQKASQPSEAYLQFYVKDTGIGIEPDQQEKIFERFRQADTSISKQYGGTGLGLSISKGFAELLDGKIWVVSERDKGSTFYFTIPYKPVVEFDKYDLISAKSTDKTNILVVEDEEYNYLLVEELINDGSIRLIHAKDGREAVEMCQLNKDIDLVLMDIKMPIMDGHTAAKLIKEFRPALPIIAQTAYALDYEIKQYSGGGFDDYITKPINEKELKQKVMKYIKIT